MRQPECTVEKELRKQLVLFSRCLSRMGFTPGTSGNLSVRLDHERLLVTPTGVGKSFIKSTDILIVDRHGRRLAGTRNVTSEIGMHLVVYNQRPDVRAVIHTHAPIATSFACSGKGLDEILCQEAVMTVGTVPLAKYATTGTAEVSASLMPYLRDHDAVLLANHGVVSYGKSLEDAFMKMETVEHLAHVALIAHQLGSARPLSREQVERLHHAKDVYLQNALAAPEIPEPPASEERFRSEDAEQKVVGASA